MRAIVGVIGSAVNIVIAVMIGLDVNKRIAVAQ